MYLRDVCGEEDFERIMVEGEAASEENTWGFGTAATEQGMGLGEPDAPLGYAAAANSATEGVVWSHTPSRVGEFTKRHRQRVAMKWKV